jgi:dUTP pyrophosphatase
MKIKIKLFDGQVMPEINKNGDWIDLMANKDIKLKSPFANTLNGKRDRRNVEFDNELIPLGIAMELPKGFEAIVLPRSSTYNKVSVCLANSQGIIDNKFRGDNDQWFFNAIAFKDTTIYKGNRICQFRIQLSQFATVWQKIKWLFWNGKIKFVKVDSLSNPDRGGHGSTGLN